MYVRSVQFGKVTKRNGNLISVFENYTDGSGRTRPTIDQDVPVERRPRSVQPDERSGDSGGSVETVSRSDERHGR